MHAERISQWAAVDGLGNIEPGTISETRDGAWNTLLMRQDRKWSADNHMKRREHYRERGFSVVIVAVEVVHVPTAATRPPASASSREPR